MTFREIGVHLYISRHTVKTEAISIYRKLDVSSRSEAIDRATELDLLRPTLGTHPALGPYSPEGFGQIWPDVRTARPAPRQAQMAFSVGLEQCSP